MDEREDRTQKQFDSDEIQGEPSQAGYPEEEASEMVSEDRPDGADETLGRSGAPRIDEGSSPPGAAGEGTQSTGNPRNAG